MNKTYIKRQITLYKLGLPMNKEVKDYYDYFHQLIDIDNLEELTHEDYPNSIFWQKDGEVILEYDTKKEHFWVKYEPIWKKFEGKYQLNYNDISELLGSMLEEAFKLKITTTNFFVYGRLAWLVEAFKLRITTTNGNWLEEDECWWKLSN